MLLDLGERCTCPKHGRVYLAVSDELDGRLETGPEPRGEASIVKVGYTGNNCRDRWKAMRECRPNGHRCYAGVHDWRVIQCCRVQQTDFDDVVFAPAARIIRGIDRIRRYEVPGHPSRRDLYALGHHFAERPLSGDAAVDVILAAVAEHVAVRVAAGPASAGTTSTGCEICRRRRSAD